MKYAAISAKMLNNNIKLRSVLCLISDMLFNKKI
tara:strand:- start:614 stop:715 length:102 start_codon:yes stop_codon:yes gene_type:complete